MPCFSKRTWAQVDLDKIRGNFRAIRAYVRSDCKVMAIVKADAYGHGAPDVAMELQKSGADYFGVSNIDEAMQIRRAGVTRPILILGYTPPEFAGELIKSGITQTVFSLEYARCLSRAALAAGGKVTIHIKIDTGMSRIGFVYHGDEDGEACTREATQAARQPGFEVEGIFTHFAVSDEPENPFTKIQFGRFVKAVKAIEQNGVKFKIRHCCNSAGLLNFPEMQLDMVRPGIILYGLTPAAGMPIPVDLEPAMELKTVISQIKTLPGDVPVSYGMKYYTDGARTLATLPIGYADGFMRRLSGSAQVLVNGKRAHIVGTICMDQCMVDITGIEGVKKDSIVTIIGRDGDAAVTMDDLASRMGTINYEVACIIGKRVPRVFIKDGRNAGTLNYILP